MDGEIIYKSIAMKLIIVVIPLLFLSITNVFCQTYQDPREIVDTTLENKGYSTTHIAYVGDKNDHFKKKISKSVLLAQQGIFCERAVLNANSVPCQVKTFKVMLIAGKNVILNEKYNNAKFDIDLIEQFKKLQKGDMIIFYDLIMQYPLFAQKANSFVYEII